MPEAGRRASPNLAEGRCAAALLLVDVINGFDFEGSEALLAAARPAARPLAALRARAAAAGVPVVYVNDNFGQWRSDFRAIVRRCLAPRAPGRAFVRRLAPGNADYFVLKPSNSGFYATVLETLLRHLGVETLVLAGLATDNCVLFTAHDAYLRGFRLFVPRDTSAAESTVRHRRALELIARTMKADTRPSGRLDLAALASVPRTARRGRQ